MKKVLIFTVTTLLPFIIIFSGCSTKDENSLNYSSRKQANSTPQTTSNSNSTAQVNTATQSDYKLTIDDVKKNYGEKEIKNVQKINSDYLLVESQKETFANKFDLYNLKTGVMDTLPTMSEFVTLEDIVSENYFTFLSSGKNSESIFSTFPHIIKCFRVKYDVPEKGCNFIAVYEDKYFGLDKSVQAGSKEGSLISDLNITFDGLEVLFKPAKGKEGHFYADATDIPPTKTIYDNAQRQMTFEIGTTQLGKGLINLTKVNIADNQYISSYEITQKNNKTQLTLCLKDTAKRYLIKSERLGPPNYFPYFSVEFADENE